MGISFDEVKQMFRESVDESKNMNEILQTVVNKIYQKGFEDGKPKYANVVFKQYDGSIETECGNCGQHLDKAYSRCPRCQNELDWNENQT